MCFLAKTPLEIVPLTTGKWPEIRSKIPDFTYKAFWRHFWPPVDPPRLPQGRPKTPQGRPRVGLGPRTAPPGTPFWRICPTNLHHVFGLPFGINFSLILTAFWMPFGLHFRVFFECFFALRGKCWTLRIYRACRVKQGSGPSKIH